MGEEAGGKISNGYKDILTITPSKIDQRIALYVGSRNIIDKLEQMFKDNKE